MDFKNTDQFKSYMKKEAKRLNITVNSAYSTYFSRVLLQRISQYNYGKFIVKGSFSQYVHLGRLTRPVLDLDIATPAMSTATFAFLCQGIYDTNDELSFDLSRHPKIKDTGIHKLSITADYGEIHHTIGIDFKPNDPTIYEVAFKKVAPIFDGDETFYANTPSIEEHIASKLYVVLKNHNPKIINTRVKDFYDLYVMREEDYDKEKMSLYFEQILKDLGEGNMTYSTRYLNRAFLRRHQETWDYMRRKDEFTDDSFDFKDAVFYTKDFLNEQLQKVKRRKIDHSKSIPNKER